MILNNIHIEPHSIKQYTRLTANGFDSDFPILSIDTDSYIVQATIQTGLNFDLEAGIHNIQIGKYCSLADDITFMVNLNHDYSMVTTAAATFLSDFPATDKYRSVRKGQILIQNDVWIGHGVTIMNGVTIHNGAVVAANSVLTKDVPPYAVVGGNPAQIIKYRFSQEEIHALQAIAWWDWKYERLEKYKKDFLLPISQFIAAHVDHVQPIAPIRLDKKTPTYLLIPDFDEPYPIYEKVIRAYCQRFGDDPNTRLLLYLREDSQTDAHIEILNRIVSQCYSGNGDIVVHIENFADERALFAVSNFFIATRAAETIRWTCYADQCGTKVISGVDQPLFCS